jgi:hypothetical protein
MLVACFQELQLLGVLELEQGNFLKMALTNLRKILPPQPVYLGQQLILPSETTQQFTNLIFQP